MKYLLIIALFCLYFTNTLYSSVCEGDKYRSELRWDSARKYICYEFGFSNIIEVYIAERDTICDVSIFDGKGICVSTTCTKSPILKWAFDDMTNETTKSSVKSDIYKPEYYKLSIFNDSCQTIISSSALITDNRDDVKKKIDELRAFMVRLWYSKCLKVNRQHRTRDSR